MSSQGRVRRYARRRRGVNVPPVENQEQAVGPALLVEQGGQVHQPAGSTQPATINLEELDDDVVISSLRPFEQANNKSRRRRLVVDVEAVNVMYSAEEAAIRLGLIQTSKPRRGHPNPPIINCELYVKLEGSGRSMKERGQYIAPPPSPKEPIFSCSVCMGPLVEEVATKCGHIFCKACIMAAIKAQYKCPTCRQKLTNRNLIRVYLPTTK